MKPYRTTNPKAMKYVAFANGKVITFPKNKVHKFEAKRVSSKAVSAGFFTKDNKGNVKTFGWSDSLNLKPGTMDKYLLERKK